MINFYCIYKHGDLRSEKLANEAVQSARRMGITVNKTPGVYTGIDEALEKEGLFVSALAGNSVNTQGVKGCFLSHYFLWKKCIEEDQAIGVLEYDAVFANPLPGDILDRFDDYCNLDYTRHLYARKKVIDYSNKIKLTNDIRVYRFVESKFASKKLHPKFNNKFIVGCTGYLLKSSGAKKLVDIAVNSGILPADIHVNSVHCSMSYTSPSVVKLNPIAIADQISHTSKK